MADDTAPVTEPTAPPFRMTPKLLVLSTCLMLATAIQSLDLTVANVALPHLQGSMSAGLDQITWVITSYSIAAAIFTPTTNFVLRKLGRRRLILLSVGLFTFASMLCGAAQSLEQIVIFRMIQGAAGAFLLPLSQTFLLDLYPPEKHGATMAVWSMGIMMVPIMGPTVGGYLTEFYSWRWAFYINIPLGGLAMLGIALLLPEGQKQPPIRFDLMGFALLSIAIGALQLMLDRGTTLDWFSSQEIVIEAMVLALAFYLFMVHMFTAPQPFLSRAAFKDRNYVMSLIIAFVAMTVAFATQAIMPTMLQSVFGYPVLTAGTLLAPRGAGGIISMAMCGRLSGRIDPRLLVGSGLVVVALAMWQVAHFNYGISESTIVANGCILGFGTGLIFAPLSALTFSTLNPQYRTEASSMFGLMRSMGGAIGVSTIATMIERLNQENHANLAGFVTPFNAVLHVVAPGLLSQDNVGAVMLNGEIERQAAIISYTDVFRALAYITAAAALFLPLVRLTKQATIDKSDVVEV
jgi:DHA2 family multidrug resistance protein